MEPDPDEQQHPGEEDLEWLDDTVKGKKPKGLYSKTSETARGLISTEKQCALFCGGKKCKYCLPDGLPEDEYAIKGLYSSWVTENILAMARPSNLAIRKFNLIQQFLDEGINSIVNLQTKGEHADCGPEKLDASGFLYNPQAFMEKGIFFYNFGWPDYGVASLSTILDMVKVMQFAVSQGKVAVHCHAGRGRTGVIIACYLVFTNRISGTEAINYVRDKRPNSIQTRHQMQVIQEFEQYLKPFWTVFASRQPGSHEFSLQQFLNRQRHILHGYEARRLKYVPKIIYIVCERLLELAKKGSSLQMQMNQSTSDLVKQYQSKTSCNSSQGRNDDDDNNDENDKVMKSYSKESLTSISGKKKRYKTSLLATRTRNKSITLEDLNDERFKAVLDGSDQISVGSSNSGNVQVSGSSDVDDDDDDCIVFGNSTVDLQAAANGRVNGEASNCKPSGNGGSGARGSGSGLQGGSGLAGNGGGANLLDNVSLQSDQTGWSVDQSVTGQLSEEAVQTVAQALSAKEVEDYVKERAAEYETQLNDTDTAWTSLSTEGDTYVLAQILWDWLDQLKEPVLRAQDLKTLIVHVEDPELGLRKVEKGTKSTIEYLVKVIGKLRPVSTDTSINLHEKLLCHLTHQWVVYEDIDVTQSWAGSTISSLADGENDDKEHWGEMRPDLAVRLFRLVHNLQQELQARSRTKLVNQSQ